MGTLIKVKFKPEILEYIRNHPKYGRDYSWVDIICDIPIPNARISYSKEFDISYFVVKYMNDIRYEIVEPAKLNKFVISKEHVVPYEQYEIKMDDGLWEI